MDDAGYLAIYEAVAAYRRDRIAAGAPNMTLETMAYQLGESEILRKVAGDAIVARLAEQNPNFKPLLEIHRDTDPARVVDKYQELLRFYTEVDAVQGASTSREDTYAKGRPFAERTYVTMTAGMSPADVAKFERTQFGAFLLRFGVKSPR